MLKLQLTLDQVNLVLRLLDDQPFGIVSPLVNTIREQCAPQLEMPAPSAPVAEAAPTAAE